LANTLAYCNTAKIKSFVVQAPGVVYGTTILSITTHSIAIKRDDTQYNDTQHNDTQQSYENTIISIMTLCAKTLDTECDCCYAVSQF
jgi:xanthine/uracil permease